MVVKEGYKQTEVGIIPEDWDVRKLRDLSGMKSGNSITAKLIKDFGKYPCYGGNGLRGYTHNYTHKGKFALIGRQGALCGNVQYVEGIFFASEHAVVVEPYSDTNIKWLSYILKDMNLNQYSESSAQPGLSVNKLLELKTMTPKTKAEQKAIATALSDIDGLINTHTKLIEKKKNIKQGAMQELLTGKKRLDGFSGEWVEAHLGEVGKCLRGVSFEGSADLCVTDNDNSVRLLRANNIYDASINKNDLIFVKSERVADKQIMKPYDILLCMASGSKELVGKSGLFKDNDRHVYTFGAFMGCFRTDASLANPVYIYYLTQSDLYKKYIAITLSGSSINNLKPSNIETMLFSVPQYKEQTAIATILSDMDSEIETLQTKLNKYKAIKQGMMQELLTGRIRLFEGA